MGTPDHQGKIRQTASPPGRRTQERRCPPRTSRIMYAIAELLPPDRRGVYAGIPHVHEDADAVIPEPQKTMT